MAWGHDSGGDHRFNWVSRLKRMQYRRRRKIPPGSSQLPTGLKSIRQMQQGYNQDIGTSLFNKIETF